MKGRNGIEITPVNVRFWRHVDKRSPEECWNWTAYRGEFGYGEINIGGKSTKAHRVSWELHFGAIPEGLGVLHKCDNPTCVNPNHLFLGTAKDNAQDMIAKGRSKYEHLLGEQHGGSKLTEMDVRAIRSQYASGGVTTRELALQYRVVQRTICKIIRRIAWRHVS